jgi:membrane complex biogenesis BtpA family protein
VTVQELISLFQTPKPLIGMVHLKPLPGSPLYKGELNQILELALQDAETIAANGMDRILIENYNDIPFMPDSVGAETVAAMTVISTKIRETVNIPIGINVLRNDARSALAIAEITNASFIRVNVHVGAMITDQGVLQGKAHDTVRYRTFLKSQVKIFADVLVKHAEPLGHADVEILSLDTFHRGLADVLIVTGKATGFEPDLNIAESIKNRNPLIPVLIGSGVNNNNLKECLKIADGIIVGTGIKAEGDTSKPVDGQRVKELVKKAKNL